MFFCLGHFRKRRNQAGSNFQVFTHYGFDTGDTVFINLIFYLQLTSYDV